MSNPVLNTRSFESKEDLLSSNHVMTASGAMLKTCFLGGLLAITFAYTWYLFATGFTDKVMILRNVGLFGGLIMVLIICFGPKNNFLSVTTSLYAMFEGLVLGSLSAMFNQFYPGIASQAAMGTVFTVLGMAILYNTGVIKCTEKLRSTVIISTFAVAGVYLLQLILSLFHIQIPGLFSNSIFGIGLSLLFIGIAAFNLILDFDFIESYSNKASGYFEWYAAFSLMVTIVWLYIEILMLLSKIMSRR